MNGMLYLPRPWIRSGAEKVFSHRGKLYVKRTVEGKKFAYWRRAVDVRRLLATEVASRGVSAYTHVAQR